MRTFFTCVFLLLTLPWAGPAAPLITVKDADGIQRGLNPPGQVTVVIYSNPSVQERTRDTGKAMDPFHGRPDFRAIVLVDLRGTMADWAAGYTVRRMIKDLDKEAARLTPVYEAKGNQNNPRPDLSAVADFRGEACLQLGWSKPENKLRIIVFDQKGDKYREWEDLQDFQELRKSVQTLLNP